MTTPTQAAEARGTMKSHRRKPYMRTEYIVRDDEGNVSFSDKTEATESFKTFRSAEKRAKELAGFAPGKAIGIYELVAETVVPVKPSETLRKRPLEYYK